MKYDVHKKNSNTQKNPNKTKYKSKTKQNKIKQNLAPKLFFYTMHTVIILS